MSSVPPAAVETLRTRLRGELLQPNDASYASEIAPFNRAIAHTPELVVVARSVSDVADAVRFAREHRVRVSVQGAGHGAYEPIASGMLISMRQLARASVDPKSRVATVEGGARWSTVLDAAVPHGLAPISGSATTVGVTGYLLGGGWGPLVRSHGVSSDYIESAEVVTGTGEIVRANETEHPELLWALRGGKPNAGIVTQLRVRLVELRTLYAGSLYFEGASIEPALRGWLHWAAGCDARLSTSVALMTFPPFDAVPQIFRGRKLLVLHVAFPGSKEEGERLTAPLRALASLYHDALGELPYSEIARIHNDPTEPAPVWVSGLALTHADDALATEFLASFGHDSSLPFVGGELRQLGAAASSDLPEGSAAGGRSAGFVLGYVGVDPSKFEREIPAASERLLERLKPWTSPEQNINFLGKPKSREHYAMAWSASTFARLEAVRKRYDPDGLFAPNY